MKRYYERYHWPLALAILLLIGEFLFPDRKRESRVSQSAEAVKAVGVAKVAASAALLLLVVAFSSTGVLASDSGALRDYKRGQYDKALQEYQSSLEKKSGDPRLQFNTGAAAYRAEKFDEAIKRFSEALNSPDLNLQQSAYYNRGNTLYYAGEHAPDPTKRNDLWKKSVQDFDSALKLKADDVDAKFNRDFVKRRLEEANDQKKQDSPQEKIEPSEEAKKAKQMADEAVKRRGYSEALQIMEAQLAKDPTTKYYDDFITRLREVTSVQSTTKSN
jgi:Ca-activated chloride channel family protein